LMKKPISGECPAELAGERGGSHEEETD